jgi:arylsulfatase A-like enzyme/Flp pilus assembly protein TadD
MKKMSGSPGRKFRGPRAALLFLFPILFFLVGSLFSAGPTGKDSNLLLITIDTLRPDRLSCYGTKYVKTPRIDALASRGVLFTGAFAHNPMTLPSHVNIMLGITPLQHGVHENFKSVVAPEFLTMAEFLKAKGYATAAFIGAFPLDSRFGLAQGFDVYDESYPSRASSVFTYPERKAEAVMTAALGWLRKQTGKWFVWIHIWDPHAPYTPPAPFDREFAADPYSGEVAYVDGQVGRVFDFLAESGLEKKTLVLFTADHGEALGEHGEHVHGYFAYNSTLWVPLILAGPGINAGRLDDYVCHVDIFPTVCEMLELEKPAHLQGISLAPVMKGQKLRPRAIYFESMDAYYNQGWAPLRGMIQDRKKFIDLPLPEVYDLAADFGEEKNIAGSLDLGIYRKKMEEVQKELSTGSHTAVNQKIDREAMERLRSLGYVVSAVTQLKKNYGPEDDLKTLLPIYQKDVLAINLYEDGRTDEAIALFLEIIKQRKDFDKSYIHLSQILTELGRAKEALAIIEQGCRDNPKNYNLLLSYGVLLVKLDKPDEGIAILQKALEIATYDPDVWTHLGIAYWKKKEYSKALESYDKALPLDPHSALLLNNLGTLYFSMALQSKKKEDLSRAVDCFEKAIAMDPEVASAYNGLGGTYKLLGENEKAISAWKRAVELNPAFDFPLYNLGVTYLEMGGKSLALEYLEKYLALKKSKISLAEKQEVEALIEKCKN